MASQHTSLTNDVLNLFKRELRNSKPRIMFLEREASPACVSGREDRRTTEDKAFPPTIISKRKAYSEVV